MADTNGGKTNNIWDSQNARLGSFLIASSFLVAAFIQLVTACNKIGIVLTHAVAALGSLIAIGYFLMNLWLVMPDWLPKCMRKEQSSNEQVLHTWLIPFFFLIFWIVAWIEVNNYWSICTVVISVGILLLIFILFIPFQKCRDKRSQKK